MRIPRSVPRCSVTSPPAASPSSTQSRAPCCAQRTATGSPARRSPPSPRCSPPVHTRAALPEPHRRSRVALRVVLWMRSIGFELSRLRARAAAVRADQALGVRFWPTQPETDAKSSPPCEHSRGRGRKSSPQRRTTADATADATAAAGRRRNGRTGAVRPLPRTRPPDQAQVVVTAVDAAARAPLPAAPARAWRPLRRPLPPPPSDPSRGFRRKARGRRRSHPRRPAGRFRGGSPRPPPGRGVRCRSRPCRSPTRDASDSRDRGSQSPGPGAPTDTRSSSDRPPSLSLRALDDLDPVAVRVTHEAESVAALAHPVGRALRLDPLLGQTREHRVEIVGRDRDMAVASADLVGLAAADVVGQLQPRLRTVIWHRHEYVDRLVADRHPPALLKAERAVEGDRAVDVEDPIAGMDNAHRIRKPTPIRSAA